MQYDDTPDPPPGAGRPTVDLRSELADPRRFERQIDRLHQRHLFTSQLYELQQEDVSLASVALNRSRVAKLLARTAARGEY